MFTTTKANTILNELCSTNKYIALKPEPTIASAANTGTGYQRHKIVSGDMKTAANKEIKNAAEIHFNMAKTDWGEITGFAIYTAASAGMEEYTGTFTTPITASDGKVVVIPIDGISIKLDA